MNESQKETIVTLLSKEIDELDASLLQVYGLTPSSSYDEDKAYCSYDEDKAYCDHLGDTLKAFQDLWDNQQMVKE